MSSIVYGRVKHPPFEDRLVLDSQNGAWDRLGPRAVRGVAQHTIVGSLLGCDAWFRRGAASNGLTDYGIGDVSDGAGLDGAIFRWNDPLGNRHPGVSKDRWPWASGPCNDMEGDGPAFVAKYGPNGVNGYLVSIERSDGGNPERPPSDKYLESFCRLTAHFADQAQIRWDQFPLNPTSGLTFYYGHYEFANKSCPGHAVRAGEGEIVEAIRALLQADQVVEDPEPVPPEPEEEFPFMAALPKSEHELDPDVIWPNASQGAVGKLWRAYGESSGSWGAPSQPWNDVQTDGMKLFVFTNGLVIATDEDGKAGVVVNVQ